MEKSLGFWDFYWSATGQAWKKENQYELPNYEMIGRDYVAKKDKGGP